MQLVIVKKVKIYPTDEQESTFWQLSNLCRLAYNFALKVRRDSYEQTGKGVSYRIQQNALPQMKKDYPHYRVVYSKVLQMVLRTLDANYRSFFRAAKERRQRHAAPKIQRKEALFYDEI